MSRRASTLMAGVVRLARGMPSAIAGAIPIALSVALSVALSIGSIGGCHGQKPVNTAEGDEELAPPVLAKATGAVATLTLVVHGPAPERYKRALERALIRANVKVADANSTAFDLELFLDVSNDVQEEIDAKADPDDPTTIGHEMSKYLATLVVKRVDGSQLDKVDANPEFELRWLSATGAVIKTIHSKEQADVEFSGEGMNTLASKLVTSEAVVTFAATRPAPAAN